MLLKESERYRCRTTIDPIFTPTKTRQPFSNNNNKFIDISTDAPCTDFSQKFERDTLMPIGEDDCFQMYIRYSSLDVYKLGLLKKELCVCIF